MVEEVEGVWEVLRFDNDFEIYNQFPYPVRKIANGKIHSEWINQNYYKIKLNGKDYLNIELLLYKLSRMMILKTKHKLIISIVKSLIIE